MCSTPIIIIKIIIIIKKKKLTVRAYAAISVLIIIRKTINTPVILIKFIKTVWGLFAIKYEK